MTISSVSPGDTGDVDELLSENARASRARVATEIATQRRRLGRMGALGGALLVVSMILGWVNHPRIIQSPSHHLYVLVETSHSIGLVTWPAGPITLVLAVGV